jgi:hypothetical protein
MRFTVTRFSDSCLFLLIDCWVWLRFPGVALRYLSRSWRHGRFPRISVPLSANDKFFWRKVFDHDPRFTALSDKLLCKEWVKSLDLPLQIAPVLWTGLDAAMIPGDILRGSVVVKANHGCGTNYFIHDGQYDRDELLRLSRRWMNRRHGRCDLQWGYFNIQRRLFVEEMIHPPEHPLRELKVFTFGDHVARLIYISDRLNEIKASMWDECDGVFHRLDHTPSVTSKSPSKTLDEPLPETTDLAIETAKEIGRGFDHLRIDFLTDGEKLWLGEVTVYNWGGYTWDGHDPNAGLSKAWDIGRSHFLCHPPADGWRRRYAEALLRVLEDKPC